MRIYVVGGPGCGKTHLALVLSRRLGLPLLQLDGLWSRLFERDASGQVAAAARRFRDDLVAEYVGREDWVIEGAEPPFVDEFAQVSDLIVWCDLPFVVAAERMIRRHLLAEVRGHNRYPGYRRLYRFLRSVHRRYVESDQSEGPWTKWTRLRVAKAVRGHEQKLLRVTGSSAERNVLSVLERISGSA